MGKYRKRPVEVEAEQWFPDRTSVKGVAYRPGLGYYVTTIHGQDTVLTPGDWVITEPDGVHHYPCKPDIFERTYERVPERTPHEVGDDDPDVHGY